MTQPTLQPEQINRVVVRGANWVGDAVMTIPALRELRHLLPRAHVTLATRAWAEGIFKESDFIDDLLIINGDKRSFLRQAREWRRKRFDLAVIFPNAFEPALLAFAAGVPVRLGYASQGRGMLLTHPLPLPSWRGQRHEVFYYLNIVGELERVLFRPPETASREPRLGLYVSEQRKQAARAMLTMRGRRSERPLIAVCPGSTNSRAKRWPAERFAAAADLLIRETGADVLLVGARAERAVSEEVAALMHCPAIVLTGETSLEEFAAVLTLCDLIVTNDTGPSHVAAAVGCPVIVIFGPTDPVTTRPFSDSAVILREPPDCAPCMLRDCPIDHRCMTAIRPEQVLDSSLRLLARRATTEAVR